VLLVGGVGGGATLSPTGAMEDDEVIVALDSTAG